MKNSRMLFSMLTVLALLFTAHVQADERYGKQKVVYHINYDDPDTQAGALRNIQNHINAVGKENLDLKVVMHGAGLSLLLTPDMLANTKMKYANATAEDPGQDCRSQGSGDRLRGLRQYPQGQADRLQA